MTDAGEVNLGESKELKEDLISLGNEIKSKKAELDANNIIKGAT